jgi:hypothetical protein
MRGGGVAPDASAPTPAAAKSVAVTCTSPWPCRRRARTRQDPAAGEMISHAPNAVERRGAGIGADRTAVALMRDEQIAVVLFPAGHQCAVHRHAQHGDARWNLEIAADFVDARVQLAGERVHRDVRPPDGRKVAACGPTQLVARVGRYGRPPRQDADEKLGERRRAHRRAVASRKRCHAGNKGTRAVIDEQRCTGIARANPRVCSFPPRDEHTGEETTQEPCTAGRSRMDPEAKIVKAPS